MMDKQKKFIKNVTKSSKKLFQTRVFSIDYGNIDNMKNKIQVDNEISVNLIIKHIHENI